MSNGKTFYKAEIIYTSVTPVEVEKYTDGSVWIGGRMRKRKTTFTSFFETPEAAFDWIESEHYSRMSSAERKAEFEKKEYAKVMKKLSKLRMEIKDNA